jgi:hypothetical protein
MDFGANVKWDYVDRAVTVGERNPRCVGASKPEIGSWFQENGTIDCRRKVKFGEAVVVTTVTAVERLIVAERLAIGVLGGVEILLTHQVRVARSVGYQTQVHSNMEMGNATEVKLGLPSGPHHRRPGISRRISGGEVDRAWRVKWERAAGVNGVVASSYGLQIPSGFRLAHVRI